MTVITRLSDSATTTPTLVLGWTDERESQTVVHDLIGGGIAVTLVDSRPRSGTMSLLYSTEANAVAARDLLASADEYTIADPDRAAAVDMQFVTLSTSLVLDDESRDAWQIDVDFQEIEP